ncbi:MAG: DUF6798 domain-containing protein [Xanthomonadales bacterium]|jgi:hypothetical protein|nr:DUF6798 domain-containing protein [Xanthomonadales bacterium]
MSNAKREADRTGLYPVLLAIACVFLLTALNYSLKNTLSMGEAQTFTYAKSFADPDYVPDDWFLSREAPLRLPYQVLVYPLVKVLPLSTAALTARLLGYLFVSIAIGLLASRLRIHPFYTSIAVATYLLFDQSLLPGQEWIFKLAESKTIAYGLVLMALYCVTGKRYQVAGALLGLATTMHILVGGWSTLAMILVVLVYCKPPWKEFFLTGAWWIVTGSFAVYSMLDRLLETPAEVDEQFQHIWTYFRNVHYVDITRWNWLAFPTIVFVFLLIALWKTPRMHPGRPEFVVVSRFALFTLAPFAAGLMVFPFSFGPKLLQLLPFRVADTLIPLLGLLITIPLLFRPDVFHRLRLPLASLLLLVGLISAYNGLQRGIHQYQLYPDGGYWGSSSETVQLHTLCEEVKRESPPGSRIIASPKLNVIPYLCERPVVVSFRDVPTEQADIAEWYRRLIDFNGGTPPRQRGYSAASEIERNFNRLSTEEYLRLGQKYEGDYLLVNRPDRLNLPPVLRIGSWYLYELE